MSLTYVQHEKLSLRSHPIFNEVWLHDRICDEPSILGLGDVRVLDRERTFSGGGRLDILLFDEDKNRRYEVEVMLGGTDPSHIIRTIEYWDIERRRYPGYDHVAVLIAENVTTRFLNVMSLLSGSIPIIAIQLEALRVGEQVLLNFVRVLDQTDLRVDDTTEVAGGGQTDRADWEKKVGPDIMAICDSVVAMINETSQSQQTLNYKRHFIGLRSNGVSGNFIHFLPRPSKKLVYAIFQSEQATAWADRFEEAGIPAQSPREGRLRLSLTKGDLDSRRELVRELVAEVVKEAEA